MRREARGGSKRYRSCLYFGIGGRAQPAFDAICRENHGLCDRPRTREEVGRRAVVGIRCPVYWAPAASFSRFSTGLGARETGQMGLKWDQAQEIAEVLTENHPGINPLQVRFTDLRQWVADLDEFDDDPGSSSESKLEAIQMAWNEIYEENNEDE